MELGKVKEIKSVQNEEICNICDELGHSTNECPKIPAFKEVVHEQVNAMNNFKKPFTSSFSDSYNPGWRNHPNFSWRNNNQAQLMQPPPPQAQQGYQNSQGYVPYVPSYWQNLEETLYAFMEKQEVINNQNTQAMIDIKDTLAKLSSALIIHEKEKFSSQPQPNPKEVEVTKSPVKPEDDDEGHQIFMIDSIMDKGTSITHDFDPSEKFLINSEFDSISNPSDVIDVSTIFYGTQDHDTQAWQSKCKEFLKKAWSITDKKGVRPLVTSHKINLEEGKWSAVEAIT